MSYPRAPSSRANLADRQALRRSPGVASRTLDGEAVLLHLSSGTYFSLNESGTLIWDLLERERTVAELLAALLATFEVDADTAQRDLGVLLEDLTSHGLVERLELREER